MRGYYFLRLELGQWHAWELIETEQWGVRPASLRIQVSSLYPWYSSVTVRNPFLAYGLGRAWG
jgi:hypothetical protein